MTGLFRMSSSLASRVQRMLSQLEVSNPANRDVAAMVYVGDVYSLRDGITPAKDSGWGDHCYTGGGTNHL